MSVKSCHQALTTTFTDFSRDLRNHWVLAMRAVFTGWAVHYIALNGVGFLFDLGVTASKGVAILNLQEGVLEWCLVVLFAGAITGFVVALSHRKSRTTMLITYALFLYALNVVSVVHRLCTDPQCCPPFAILLKFGYPIIGLTGTFLGGFLIHAPKTISEQAHPKQANS